VWRSGRLFNGFVISILSAKVELEGNSGGSLVARRIAEQDLDWSCFIGGV
jgi:hypothetical protein